MNLDNLIYKFNNEKKKEISQPLVRQEMELIS